MAELVLIDIPDGAEECIWVSDPGSSTARETRVRENGTRNGDDCTVVVVTRDYVLDTGGGGGDSITLDASAIFDYPSIPTASSLYSLGFAAIVGPALLLFVGSRIISALRGID